MPVEVPPTDTPPLELLDREALIESLNQMTLPLMWAMRKEAQRTLEPLGIRPVTMLMLEALSQGLAAYPKDLSEMLDTVPSAVSALLTDVEGQGLVRRETDPDDGRRVRLAVTAKGERLRDEVRERWRHGDHRRVERLTDDDLRTLLRIYRTLLES
jgi:DNA-binding MarR family transcriptional regulator